jgi:hypothetical protein
MIQDLMHAMVHNLIHMIQDLIQSDTRPEEMLCKKVLLGKLDASWTQMQ